MSVKGVKEVESKKRVNEEHGQGRERTHAEKDEQELLFCLTSTQASCDLQIQLREIKV